MDDDRKNPAHPRHRELLLPCCPHEVDDWQYEVTEAGRQALRRALAAEVAAQRLTGRCPNGHRFCLVARCWLRGPA